MFKIVKFEGALFKYHKILNLESATICFECSELLSKFEMPLLDTLSIEDSSI